MCDYCSCRSMPVIEALGADHDRLLARSAAVRRAMAHGAEAAAHAELGRLLDDLRRHTAVEEASVFTGLRAAGELLGDVDVLAGEHGELEVDAARLDHLEGAGWDAAARDLLDALHDHISREEYDLFPATLLAIGPAEWDALEQAALRVRAGA